MFGLGCCHQEQVVQDRHFTHLEEVDQWQKVVDGFCDQADIRVQHCEQN